MSRKRRKVMQKRTLGRSGIEVAPLGLGCMRLSSKGWYLPNGNEVDFGEVDDEQSVKTINMAIDMGINLFDTAIIYGAGHNEELLGRAVGNRREEVVIVSKVGSRIDEEKRLHTGKNFYDTDPRDVKILFDGSLRRLKTDYIDVYLLHTSYKDDKVDIDKAAVIRDCMEELVQEGKLKGYGWSTDWPHQLKCFMEGPHCIGTEQDFNIFAGNEETLKLCEDNNLASLCRSPLAGGALTPKPTRVGKDDRGGGEDNIKKFQAVHDVLTSDGRTVVQGALCWLWARSPVTIPIPGFRTETQARENIGALEFGPLTLQQMEEVESIVNI
jgi:aryl-alcohol dehydrogenase-like predicted oxidoreductase